MQVVGGNVEFEGVAGCRDFSSLEEGQVVRDQSQLRMVFIENFSHAHVVARASHSI